MSGLSVARFNFGHHFGLHRFSPGTRRLIIFVPPLVIGTFYICRRFYLYLKFKDKPSPPESVFYDACDFSRFTSPDEDDNSSVSANNTHWPDGCVMSTTKTSINTTRNGRKRSALNNSKCNSCRSQQKLSFKDTNVLETSLKNLSTAQLVKLGQENLQNVAKALEEMKMKQNILKEYKLDTSSIDSKIESLNEKIEQMMTELEAIRTECMPVTTPLSTVDIVEDDGDDFDDQASYMSTATTTSLGYWDPEPNLHFFQLYQDALKLVMEPTPETPIKPPKTDRTIMTGCENYEDFLAKVHCLRQAFSALFVDMENRNRFIRIGHEILRIILEHSFRDSNDCFNAYYAFLDYVQNEANHPTIEMEITARGIAMLSFYDIVLDYMILESLDDLENPPSAVRSIISNQWLSASFREIALQTTVSTVMRRKRSKLIVNDGFFEHFYQILDHLSPILAWGFLGTNETLRFKCESIKDSTRAVIRDYFSFDRCRYTYLEDLCDDIKRVSEERFWELNHKLKIINS